MEQERIRNGRRRNPFDKQKSKKDFPFSQLYTRHGKDVGNGLRDYYGGTYTKKVEYYVP